ncbi:hypothetical protein LCGC14_1258790 [marine sediment metagenome]|uniref:Uncharacterized protein n=1 Tax=marine sediment metagenome TaxID=412755 RepID=A0A0F9L1B0_9ZZZZ
MSDSIPQLPVTKAASVRELFVKNLDALHAELRQIATDIYVSDESRHRTKVAGIQAATLTHLLSILDSGFTEA